LLAIIAVALIPILTPDLGAASRQTRQTQLAEHHLIVHLTRHTQSALRPPRIKAPTVDLMYAMSSLADGSTADGPDRATVNTAAITPAAAAVHHPRIIWMQVTAYCPCKRCCGPNAHGITASGKPVTANGGVFVAADTDLLPLGVHVIVPGYNGQNPVEVIDRGSAIKGNRLDVFFPTHEQAMAWGRQWLAVTVME
jgi:3D (Asp-Asp-Asp) domain-containing protein